MNRTQKVAGFLFVALLGAYGCAKAPVADGGGKSATDAKVQRLEEDFRAAAAARDSFRLKLTQAEERHAAVQAGLQRQLAAAAAERDGLKAEVKARITERDALQTHYESFRKNIKDLLGQAESSLGTPPAPALVGTAGT